MSFYSVQCHKFRGVQSLLSISLMFLVVAVFLALPMYSDRAVAMMDAENTGNASASPEILAVVKMLSALKLNIGSGSVETVIEGLSGLSMSDGDDWGEWEKLSRRAEENFQKRLEIIGSNTSLHAGKYGSYDCYQCKECLGSHLDTLEMYRDNVAFTASQMLNPYRHAVYQDKIEFEKNKLHVEILELDSRPDQIPAVLSKGEALMKKVAGYWNRIPEICRSQRFYAYQEILEGGIHTKVYMFVELGSGEKELRETEVIKGRLIDEIGITIEWSDILANWGLN